MFPTHTTVVAGSDINEGDYIWITLEGDTSVGYPVETHFERLLLPRAIEDASKGEPVGVKS